jgi:alkylhydroperoxidase/carboxymuconolactone decarboxylase family protein YurZ
VADGYAALADACRAVGPLDGRSVALVKLAVSVGRSTQRTVHAHAKKALREGISPGELRQVALTALPTIGLPAALDALSWIDQSIEEYEASER